VGRHCSLYPLRQLRKAASPFRPSRVAVLPMFQVDSASRLAAKIHGRADIPKQRPALLQHMVETTRIGPTDAMISRPVMIRTSARHPRAPVVFNEDSLVRRSGLSKAESCPLSERQKLLPSLEPTILSSHAFLFLLGMVILLLVGLTIEQALRILIESFTAFPSRLSHLLGSQVRPFLTGPESNQRVGKS